ncbi:MAG: glycosyltransferase family 4 protein [Candidatus Moraniibacteriota bacterium]|nr:MAG: glycosyltransferase family 4 protein [Candidatus Moranbacteria bacterium]
MGAGSEKVSFVARLSLLRRRARSAQECRRVLRAYKRLLDFRKADHTMPPVPPLVLSGKLLPHLAPLVTDVERLVRELNLSPFVRILGFVPQEDLPALYRNAKLFFFPSRYEGFGLPILEAMNMGAPVLTSKMSSLPEVARDAALYCHPDDIDDMARTLRSLLLSDTLQDTLVRRGHARAAQFSWEHFSRKLLHILTGDLSV